MAIGAVNFHSVTSGSSAVTAKAAGSSPVVPANIPKISVFLGKSISLNRFPKNRRPKMPMALAKWATSETPFLLRQSRGVRLEVGRQLAVEVLVLLTDDSESLLSDGCLGR